MTQISKRQLDKNTEKRIYEIFVDVIADAKNTQDVESLLNDFFTYTERVMLPKRLCIAYLLLKGYDQRAIASYLKVSFTTINRVSTALKSGGKGYTLILTRLQKHEQFEALLKKIDDGIIDMIASIAGPRQFSRYIHSDIRRHAAEEIKPF